MRGYELYISVGILIFYIISRVSFIQDFTLCYATYYRTFPWINYRPRLGMRPMNTFLDVAMRRKYIVFLVSTPLNFLGSSHDML